MSTRAAIIIRDQHNDELCFYRHSDGYPEGTMPSLEKFLGWVKDGRIQNSVEQAAGWLIMLGASEYNTAREPIIGDNMGWKVGAYEPATEIHGDCDFLYVIDLHSKTIHIEGHGPLPDHYIGKFGTLADPIRP